MCLARANSKLVSFFSLSLSFFFFLFFIFFFLPVFPGEGGQEKECLLVKSESLGAGPRGRAVITLIIPQKAFVFNAGSNSECKHSVSGRGWDRVNPQPRSLSFFFFLNLSAF